jgi:hypothetical protein
MICVVLKASKDQLALKAHKVSLVFRDLLEKLVLKVLLVSKVPRVSRVLLDLKVQRVNKASKVFLVKRAKKVIRVKLVLRAQQDHRVRRVIKAIPANLVPHLPMTCSQRSNLRLSR